MKKILVFLCQVKKYAALQPCKQHSTKFQDVNFAPYIIPFLKHEGQCSEMVPIKITLDHLKPLE